MRRQYTPSSPASGSGNRTIAVPSQHISLTGIAPAVTTGAGFLFMNQRTGLTYSTLQAAHDASSSGDTILVSPQTYLGMVGVVAVSNPNFTIKSSVPGVRPFFNSGGAVSNSSGLIYRTPTAANGILTIQDIELSTGIIDPNGPNGSTAALYTNNTNDTYTLNVIGCYVHDCYDGILIGRHVNATINLINTEWAYNGFNDGLSHNIYISGVGVLNVQGCWSHNADGGHLLKSRAKVTTVTACRMTAEGGGRSGASSSLESDFSCGGTVTVQGCLFQQCNISLIPNDGSGNTSNNDMIGFNREEGNLTNCPVDGRTQSFKFVQNTVVDDHTSTGTYPGTMLSAGSSGFPAGTIVQDNVFCGPTAAAALAAFPSNHVALRTDFVDPDNFNYALTTPIAGSQNWTNLAYSHPTSTVTRLDSNQGGVGVAIPAAISGMASGTVKNIGLSWLSGLGPDPNTNPAQLEPNVGVFSYASGGLLVDPYYLGSTLTQGPAMVLFGGGHQAYSGNEIPVFNLFTMTWAWMRRSFVNAPKNVQRESDGTPASNHSYADPICPPGYRMMIKPTNPAFFADSASGSYGSDYLDFTIANPNTNNPWSHGNDIPLPAGYSDGGAGSYGGFSVWDSDNKRVIYSSGSGNYFLAQYVPILGAPAGGTWTSFNPNAQYSYSDRKVGAYIPGKKWVASLQASDGNGRQGLWILDASAASLSGKAYVKVTMSGTPPNPDNQIGITWDSTNNRLIAGGYGNTLYFCTPPATIGSTWNWTSQTFTGDTVAGNPNVSGSGIWGRFAFVASYGGVIAIPWANAQPAFFKL